MKKYILMLVCLVAVLGAAWAAGKGPASRGNQNASVVFNGKTFHLQYSVGNAQEWLNEYLPSGQNFNNYTEMIAVRSYDGVKATPMQIAQYIAGNYAKKYPGVKYLLAGNKETGDGLVSYIMIEGNILEYNLFRTTAKNGVPMAIQYVYRRYLPQATRSREDLSSFGKETSQRQVGWINALDAMPVPQVVRSVKQ